MKNTKLSILLSIVLVVSGITTGTTSTNNSIYADIPFDMPIIQAPIFNADTLYLSDFGAIGDGFHINTHAFKDALGACEEKGGAVLVVPRGTWLTGPIAMKSNVNLHLASGALIQFTGRFEDYPIIKSTWEGLEEYRCIAPISGFDLENIAITGEGIIDGAGEHWRPVKRFKMTDRQWKELKASGGVVDADGKVWWPSESAMKGRQLVKKLRTNPDATANDYAAAREYLRPVLVNLVRCKNVLLDGPTFQNSPAWNIHPLMCENVLVRNVTVRNPWFSQNGDGIDIESCTNVLVYDNSFDVGDDAICIKSGKNEYGRRRGMPSENIVIQNNTVYHGHGGFTVGSEMSGGVKNILVRDCTFIGTDVGLRFKSTRGRGGIVENIYIDNIYMTNIPMEALRFNMFYENKAPIPENPDDDLSAVDEPDVIPIDESTPIFRNINISNIYCRGAGQAILIKGLPEMPLSNVTMKNIQISAEKGIQCVDARDIQMQNIAVTAEKHAVITLYNSSSIEIDTIDVNPKDTYFLSVSGSRSQDIVVSNPQGNLTPSMIAVSKDLDTKTVQINK